jgi:nicotinic acid mononucleotide adenylyltransferase
MIGFNRFFTEQIRDGKLVIIYSGRFQPAHKGHAAAYQALVDEFPEADVWIATSNVVKADSPFNFQERKYLLEKAGVPGNRIVQVVSTYVAKEITSKYNDTKDHLVYIVSQKDADRFSYGPKKDGTLPYLQKFENVDKLLPMSEQGYVKVGKTFPFKVLGKTVTGATQIRDMYKHISDQERKQIIIDLYGKFDQGIYNLFNKKLK